MRSQRPGSVTLLDMPARRRVARHRLPRSQRQRPYRRQDLYERVFGTAAALNYTANAQAQAMARGRMDVVGAAGARHRGVYFAAIAVGVIEAAERHRLLVTLASTVRRPLRELQYLAALRRQRARAVIPAGSRVDDPELTQPLRRELDAFESTGSRTAVISQNKLVTDGKGSSIEPEQHARRGK